MEREPCRCTSIPASNARNGSKFWFDPLARRHRFAPPAAAKSHDSSRLLRQSARRRAWACRWRAAEEDAAAGAAPAATDAAQHGDCMSSYQVLDPDEPYYFDPTVTVLVQDLESDDRRKR